MPGAATTAPSSRVGQTGPHTGAARLGERGVVQVGAARAAGVILWGNSQHLFSVKIHRKAGTTGYHSFRRDGVEGGGVYNKVLMYKVLK